ncbi:MAG: N-acetylmuramoyl-L-alanine amidase [Bryobacterales bacterium]|nr:N-acetylmuramoyl-L-alanine amidase [Bryobacterales bacterium]
MKLIAALLLTATVAVPRHASRERSVSVTAVRHWSQGDVTRIAIEMNGEFQYSSDRVPNPDRVYFDIHEARLRIGARGAAAIPVGDSRVRQIRVAQTQRRVTRIVLDLNDGAEVAASRLASPDRLIIEVRSKPGAGAPLAAPSTPATASTPAASARPAVPVARKRFVAPRQPVLVARAPDPIPAPPHIEGTSFAPISIALPVPVPPARPELATRRAVARKPPVRSSAPLTDGKIAGGAPRPAGVVPDGGRDHPPAGAGSAPQAARKNSDGERSMTRVLGLKVGRIVIDPGHGGHDTGTIGYNGLIEKDLVLDVARRLGKLIGERMGSEVVFTRSDDTFIPLETRTAIANEHRADLFLSIHANSSPLRSIGGVETFYLNFSSSKSDLDVAARENASSRKTVYELKDLLQRIALQDKIEESKEFAGRVQAALYGLSSRSIRQRNRGVKKAPFVVLIGAQMPSILAEIGFVSNAHEENLMKRSDYRDKLAEALYKGVAQYASTLSHFQIAHTSGE